MICDVNIDYFLLCYSSNIQVYSLRCKFSKSNSFHRSSAFYIRNRWNWQKVGSITYLIRNNPIGRDCNGRLTFDLCGK